MNNTRWRNLMRVWGFEPNKPAYEALFAAYTESHRHYHTVEHIKACLYHLDTCREQLDQPHEIELALWFHDAVYQPLASNNEQKSADWAVSFLTANGASSETIDRIYRLIMVTKHDEATQTRDESFLVDIDLSILGADSATYDQFEQGIRQEYRAVPKFLYRRKRAAVLQSFLSRPRIYHNEPFISEREQQARANLIQAITNLTV